ncbi:MAG: molybdenum cofactor biosynthesis protein MoaE, partial [Pyrinomonadaceae bacterium]
GFGIGSSEHDVIFARHDVIFARHEVIFARYKMSEKQSDFYEITAESLDVGAIARRVVPPECGATVTLDGYVRQFTKGRETLYLEYEGYEPMALKEMEKLIKQAHAQFEIANVGIVHRLGRLEIGETSVVIAVAAPHRRAAFEACEWLIKELKRVVPIWKKEVYAGGENWVEGESSI